VKKRKSPAKAEVEFDFVKSNYFRVVKGDGAFGGVSPNGSIHMGIYSERAPFPKKIVHELIGGGIGDEITSRRETRNAIVREIEVDVVLQVEQAVALRDWLDRNIKRFYEMQGDPSPRPDITNVGVNK